jgi:hypothetical protein
MLEKDKLLQKDSLALSRRDFFSRFGDGLHGAALAWLLGSDLFSVHPLLASTPEEGRPVYDLKPRSPEFHPKATSVIHLFMNGGPSQVDLFDPKPTLNKFAGSAPSRDIVNEIEFANEVGSLLPSSFKYSKHGKAGIEVSELMPHLSECVMTSP